jgi:cell wall-associated NlpC family hydrolase
MKIVTLSILLMVSFFAFSQDEVKCEEAQIIEIPNIFTKVIDYAQSKIGFRYGRNGFDCSGLVAKAFNSIGVVLPHSSKMQSKLGDKIAKTEAQPGDLIFFSSPRSGKKTVGHVGIVTEVTNNVVHFVHAAVKGGVMISKLTEAYYQKHFMLIKRNQIEPQIVQN